MTEKLLIPVILPGWLVRFLRKVKRAFIPPSPVVVNILGERYVEWSFLSREMPDGSGLALEFGCENAYLSLLAAQKGYHVLASDLEEQHFPWHHPNFQFRCGDFLKIDLPEDHFDLIINCSSVEHVGIAGRYGITAEQSNGDIEVMERFARILKPGGLLLMTAPCGRDAVLPPWCRVYGSERLPRLLSPFYIDREEYWVKDTANRWVATSRETALGLSPVYDPENAHGCSYALGCFVLRRKADVSPGASREAR
jgi:SAM-dependent methyltransferase